MRHPGPPLLWDPPCGTPSVGRRSGSLVEALAACATQSLLTHARRELAVDEQAARDGMYAVKLDPQHWFDQAISRVFDAANEFEVLELPVEWCEDATLIKKQYRKISLSVHPDKNKHPQAVDAFRKVCGLPVSVY